MCHPAVSGVPRPKQTKGGDSLIFGVCPAAAERNSIANFLRQLRLTFELLLSVVIVNGRWINKRARDSCTWRESFGECDLGVL